MTMPFELDVQQVNSRCLFKLTWGNGQKLMADLPYPEIVFAAYHHWEKAYLAFYQTNLDLEPPPLNSISNPLRARVEQSGALAPPSTDWRLRLAQAQVTLLSEFQGWLSSRELLPIRSAIAQAPPSETPQAIELFLTCNTLDLDRLPWETWEILTEFASSRDLRLARTPMNMPESPITKPIPRRRRSRILVILGDESGLDFSIEKQALQSFNTAIDVTFIGWQRNQPDQNQVLKDTIQSHLTDPKGWEMLFFIGHSNENLGGEISIAPNQGILIHEILPALRQAKAHGLQFALFNSCRGLNIAQSLLSIGLPQVAIMRQPIHNRVASEFLVQLIQQLSQYHDIHSAFITACNFLKVNKNQTYPSAFLIPSLFRHPTAPLFQLSRLGWRKWIQRSLPRRREAIALGSCMLVSLVPSVQGLLLEQRILLQSIYRSITHQVPTNLPPVRLVQIDPETLKKTRVRSISPMDRSFLATIVDHLSESGAKVVGIDYFFDRPSPDPKDDQNLAQAIDRSVKKNQTWFVLAEAKNDEGELKTSEATGIATKSQALVGLVNVDRSVNNWYLQLPNRSTCSPDDCPFPNLLTLAHLLNHKDTLKPQITSTPEQWQSQVLKASKDEPKNSLLYQIRTQHELAITDISRFFQQLWLQPILDFSIPPTQVFNTISAGEFVTTPTARNLDTLSNQIVIITSGGYLEGNDVYDRPFATTYWHLQDRGSTKTPKFTGAESIAYSIHHQLNQHWIIPIPDLWMIAIAGLIGKVSQLYPKLRHRRRIWLGTIITYIVASFQVYITAGILMPCLFPITVIIVYSVPFTWRKLFHAKSI